MLLLGNKTDNEKEREVPNGMGEHLAKVLYLEVKSLQNLKVKAFKWSLKVSKFIEAHIIFNQTSIFKDEEPDNTCQCRCQ